MSGGLKSRKELTEMIVALVGSYDSDGKRRTYRSIAEVYYPDEEANRMGAILWKIANKKDYTPGVRVCRRLGIHEPVKVAPCPTCGKPPNQCSDCRRAKNARPRPPRIAIRKDDMASAARTLTRNLTAEQVADLRERLKGD